LKNFLVKLLLWEPKQLRLTDINNTLLLILSRENYLLKQIFKIRTMAKNKLNYIPNGFILFKKTSQNLLRTVEKKYCLIFNFGTEELFYLLKDLLILYNEIIMIIL
jgi:hypothetical protein